MQHTVPVTVVSGYLGSGKTTLINHWLKQSNGIKLAVLVNDFGELAIDAALIEAEEGDVVSLTGGCICCSFGDDLSKALQSLKTRISTIDHIVIESSGVALPGAIVQSLSLQRSYAIHAVLTLVDAASIREQLSDRYIGETVQTQLSHANIALLNKADLVDEHEYASLLSYLEDVYSHVRFMSVVHASAPISLLVDSIDSSVHRFARRQARQADCPEAHQKETQTVSAVSAVTQHSDTQCADEPDTRSHDTRSLRTFSFYLPDSLNALSLAERLADEQCALLRAKGFVMHEDGKIKLIQVVGNRWSVSDAPTSLAAESVSLGLVCIGLTVRTSKDKVSAWCQIT